MGYIYKESERKFYIDFIKIIAIVFVYFNHTSQGGFWYFATFNNSIQQFFYLFITVLSKVAVPLFFMASGAILLGKNEDIKSTIKRVIKYFLILIVTSVGYYSLFRDIFLDIGVVTQILSFHIGGISTFLWYLYHYIGYLLFLPFLRKIASSMTKKEYVYIFIIFALIQAKPIFDYVIWNQKYEVYIDGFNFWGTISVFYPLIGYYLDKYLSNNSFSKKKLLILTALSIVAIMITCVLTLEKNTNFGTWKESNGQDFFGALIAIPSITIFILTNQLFKKIQLKNFGKRLMYYISKNVFALYLLSGIIINETYQKSLFVQDTLASRLGIYNATLIWNIYIVFGMALGLHCIRYLIDYVYTKTNKD